MKTLVIDNIDSFVYNLVQYLGMEGGNPIVLQNTATKGEVDKTMESGVDRIVISPGPKAPKDAGVSNYVIEEYGPRVPTLGVCLGHQCIGYVYGARIRHARNMMHGKTSEIRHTGEAVLRGMPNPFTAARYHSLVIDDVPAELSVFATSLDDGEVMAVRHRRHPVYGVQFHPESIMTADGMRIIRNFLGDGL